MEMTAALKLFRMFSATDEFKCLLHLKENQYVWIWLVIAWDQIYFLSLLFPCHNEGHI